VPAPEVPAPATAETAAPAEVAAQNAERPAARPADAAAGETADAAPAEGAAGAAADTAGEAAGQTAPSDIAAAATESIEADIPAAPDIPTQVAATGRVYGAVNEDSRITLTATADSWVQVRSAEGNLLITRVLREGDVYRAPNRDGLVLETGNAGGLRITVDGRPAPQLGRPGDVVRGISLEPEALLAGRAVR
jgi:cytoskeleton protein RodZ